MITFLFLALYTALVRGRGCHCYEISKNDTSMFHAVTSRCSIRVFAGNLCRSRAAVRCAYYPSNNLSLSKYLSMSVLLTVVMPLDSNLSRAQIQLLMTDT